MPTTTRNTDILFNDSSTQASGRQAARAYANFNGTAATIRSSYNVSSITKNATGRYYINFTTAMSDSNYATVASSSESELSFGFTGSGPVSTTQAYISVYVSTFYVDQAFVNVCVFR